MPSLPPGGPCAPCTALTRNILARAREKSGVGVMMKWAGGPVGQARHRSDRRPRHLPVSPLISFPPEP